MFKNVIVNDFITCATLQTVFRRDAVIRQFWKAAMISTQDLVLSGLKAAYQNGDHTPTTICEVLTGAIDATYGIFISRPSSQQIQERCKYLESLPVNERGALWGVPFAVKDNIDVKGLPTTCACPEFAYTPSQSAPVVDTLLAAGGICMGKTNLDQFACGLVGTRSPYGIAPNAFDDRFVPGGSSSGSAVAVAQGLVSFALGTDTAGSGRVPAGLNGIVGIKPTVGRCSTKGVVPACFSLDCPSVFALSVEDGVTVANIMQNNDSSDHTWRPQRTELLTKSLSMRKPGPRFRFGVPSREFLDFSGPGGDVVRRAMETAMVESINRMRMIGGEMVDDFDFSCFAETAALLYGSAFVAERYAGIREFLECEMDQVTLNSRENFVYKDERILKVTRAIIGGGQRFSAADVYDGLQKLATLKAASRVQLEKIDVFIVPTAAYNYTVEEIKGEEDDIPGMDVAHPILPSKNANLGRFTNFANLLDLCGVSVPSGLMQLDFSADDNTAKARSMHLTATGKSSAVLPFGITIIAPNWTDSYAGLQRFGMAYNTLAWVFIPQKWKPQKHTIKPALNAMAPMH